MACSRPACRAEGARRTQHGRCCGGRCGRELASGEGDVSLDWKVTWARGRGDQLAWPFWEPRAHGTSLLFQERIFLTVSNYIFTAIFVGEMTLKVTLLHLGPLPAQGPPALTQPCLEHAPHLSISNIPQCPLPPQAPGLRGPGAVSARSLLSRGSQPARKAEAGKHFQSN